MKITNQVMQHCHQMPFGPVLHADGTIEFRIWAPQATSVNLLLYTETGTKQHKTIELTGGSDLWWTVRTDEAKIGSRYHFQINDEWVVPDPASRFQPADVHGPSQVIDPNAFTWTQVDWKGLPWHQAVVYEMHVGSFTPEGTYDALVQRLDYLVELGVTAIELMPLADFPGGFNWGYDGVLLFAPDSTYGTPDDLKTLIDEAHRRGIMVFLDVVYNHFGPEGNYLYVYAKPFFNFKLTTPWGNGINYDGEHSSVVRDFVKNNVLYWLEEYRFDGLRFDAVDTIYDTSRKHILHEIAEAVNEGPGKERYIHLVLENGTNDATMLTGGTQKKESIGNRPTPRKDRFTAQWNDDLHHTLHVLATGETSGYFADFTDENSDFTSIEHLGRCLAEGFSYQGQRSVFWGDKARGSKSKHLPPGAFVSFIQNHDQVGNRAFGERITQITEPDCVRALSALTLLAPLTPMLFMGEEWAASTPYLWFSNFSGELAESVREGRFKEFNRFEDYGDLKSYTQIPDPTSEKTFQLCKLNWDETTQDPHLMWLGHYKHLLTLRRGAIVPILDQIAPEQTSWKILEEGLLEVRWALKEGGELKLLANLSDQGCASPIFAEADFEERSILFQTPPSASVELAMGTVPPWTVIWLLMRAPIVT